jgi:hypothetical protein
VITIAKIGSEEGNTMKLSCENVHEQWKAISSTEVRVQEQSLFASRRRRLTPTTAQYWIPAHVYVCATPLGGVLLDVRHDRYMGIGSEHMKPLASLVHGWPYLLHGEADPNRMATTIELARELERCGTLSREESAGSLMTGDFRSHQPMLDIGLDIDCEYRIRPGHVLNYLKSLLLGLWLLNFHSLESIVNRTLARKRCAAALAIEPMNVAQTAALVKIYRRLKSFSYTGRGRCMLDSLVLLEFLAMYRIYPTWTLGVTTAPFTAHSWLETENFIVGGTPEDTAYAYTRIMMV